MIRLAPIASLLVASRILTVSGPLVTLFVCGVTVSAEAAISLGSGFFITIDGYFVTSHHVIENANTIKIRDSRRTTVIAAVQAGNSGGPLVNGSGNVVGVVTAKLSSIRVLQRTGDLPQNVNYAMKSNYLLELVSPVEGLEPKLLKERSQPFSDLEALGAFLSRSIGLVIAEGTETSGAERRKATTTFPRI